MAFSSKDFIFAGIPSQQFGLQITSEGSGEDTTPAGSDVELKIEKIYRRPRLYLLGVDQSPILSFPVSFNANVEINAVLAANIESFLFGQMRYQKLQVIAPDYSGIYWNCFLKSPETKRVGNVIVGWNAQVVCDSPWAYTTPKTTTYNYTPPLANVLLDYINLSGNNDYTYPIISFTMSNTGGNFSIRNVDDNNRTASFTDLSANEVITIDTSLQIITSSLDLKRLGDFNKKWPRLIRGRNRLRLSGNITQLTITNSLAQKIGG